MHLILNTLFTNRQKAFHISYLPYLPSDPSNSMYNLNWINILHFYQPPCQNADMLKKICKNSYDFIYQNFKKHPNQKLTINFNGSLTELLVKNKLQGVIKNFKQLASNGQIEFLETAKYHPILSLIPEYEIERQIMLNHKINKAYFGASYSPTGFFCPEMAYNEKVGKIIKKLGYKYIVLDEIASGKMKKIDTNCKYIDKKTGLEVIFRNRRISKTFPPDYLAHIHKKGKGENCITATDAELYGFYHQDIFKNFNRMLDRIQTKTVSQYIKGLKDTKEIKIYDSCWENTEKDIAEKRPFKIWKNSKNPIQTKLWKLAELAIKANNAYNRNENVPWARKHLDRGLASCSWWWASQKKFSAFSPISWNPDDIEKGALELIKSIRSLEAATQKEILYAEKNYSKLIQLIWKIHWKKTKKYGQ